MVLALAMLQNFVAPSLFLVPHPHTPCSSFSSTLPTAAHRPCALQSRPLPVGDWGRRTQIAWHLRLRGGGAEAMEVEEDAELALSRHDAEMQYSDDESEVKKNNTL